MKHPFTRAHSGSRTVSGLVAVAAIALVVSGCGTSSSDSASGGGKGSGPTPGYDASTKTFTVASIEPMTGPLGGTGTNLSNGMKLYFDALNAKGGIDGKYKIKYDAEDSQYNPQIVLPLYNRIKGKTAIISGMLGSNIVAAVKPQLVSDNFVALADASSAALVNDPNLIPFGTSTQVNMVNLAAYAATKLGHQNDTFCSITQADDLGKENREGIQFAVKELNLKFGVDASVQQGDTNFTPQIQQLQKAGCKVVLDGATTAQMPGLIAAAVQLGFNAQWMGQNNVYDASFASSPIAPYLQQHFLTTLIGVPWGDSSAGMSALRDAVAKFAPNTKPSNWIELGYAHAMLVTAILQQAVKDGDFTRAGIMKASTEVGDFDYQGLLPTYGYNAPKDRTPPLVTGIYKVDPSQPMGLAAVDPTFSSPKAADYYKQ